MGSCGEAGFAMRGECLAPGGPGWPPLPGVGGGHKTSLLWEYAWRRVAVDRVRDQNIALAKEGRQAVMAGYAQ
jgi:hypothetical protein